MNLNEIKIRGNIANMNTYLGCAAITADIFSQLYPEVPVGLLHALGLKANTVELPVEDSISFAKNSVDELLKHTPPDILTELDYVEVGTETIQDGSLPISNHIVDLLHEDLVSNETKHACVAAMNSIWRNVRDNGLIVATDIAQYGSNAAPSANFTGGAGSVAIMTHQDGKLLEILDVRGAASSLRYDFFKPYSIKGNNLSGNTYPVVFGKYSNICNYEKVGQAYASLKKRVDITLDDVSGIVLHTPYPSITKYNLAYLMLIDQGSEILEEVEMLTEKAHEAFEEYDFGIIQELEREIKILLREVMQTDVFEEHYKKLEPSLKFISQVGNIYTGSSPLCMMSLLENVEFKSDQYILWSGYGSGNQAIMMVARTTEQTNSIISTWNTQRKLDCRYDLSTEEYCDLDAIDIRPDGYQVHNVDKYGIKKYIKPKPLVVTNEINLD